jgi:hypothetical protein
MRVRLGGAVGLITVVLLAACNGSDQPSTLPDTTPTGSSVPASEAVSPTPTADPTAKLEAEITEFFEAYIETSNASWTSKEALARRREMFVNSCAACLVGYEMALRAHEDGLTFDGELGRVEEVRIDDIEGDIVRFLGFTTTPAARLVGAGGNVVQEFPPTRDLQVVYQVQRLTADDWVIIQSEVLG